jgi:transcriptional regulator with XRE-family HTH domain
MDSERAKALKKTLGGNIRLARLRQGLTQEQTAELIGMSPEVYGRMERGGIYPRVETLMVICEQLGASADQLLGLSEPDRTIPTTEIAPPRDDWFVVLHRLTSLLPRLTQYQRAVARRQVVGFYRVLHAFVEPEAAAKQQKRKSAPAQDS